MTELQIRLDGVSNTITTVQKDNLLLERLIMEKVKIQQATQKEYIECEVGGVADFSYPTSELLRGRVQGGGQVSINTMPDGTCRTIKNQYYKTSMANFERNSTYGATGVLEKRDKVGKIGQISSEGSQSGTVLSDDDNMTTLTAGTHGYANPHICTNYRIRKLTPLECWRLMGFSDNDFHKAEEVNSNTQLYKQAGNSIVENVLVAIFGQMLPRKETVYMELGNRNYNEEME